MVDDKKVTHIIVRFTMEEHGESGLIDLHESEVDFPVQGFPDAEVQSLRKEMQDQMKLLDAQFELVKKFAALHK